MLNAPSLWGDGIIKKTVTKTVSSKALQYSPPGSPVMESQVHLQSPHRRSRPVLLPHNDD